MTNAASDLSLSGTQSALLAFSVRFEFRCCSPSYYASLRKDHPWWVSVCPMRWRVCRLAATQMYKNAGMAFKQAWFTVSDFLADTGVIKTWPWFVHTQAFNNTDVGLACPWFIGSQRLSDAGMIMTTSWFVDSQAFSDVGMIMTGSNNRKLPYATLHSRVMTRSFLRQ